MARQRILGNAAGSLFSRRPRTEAPLARDAEEGRRPTPQRTVDEAPVPKPRGSYKTKKSSRSALGQLVEEYIQKRKTTQVAIADHIGRSQVSISNLMRGVDNEARSYRYLGMKKWKGDRLLDLVVSDLRIPMSKVRAALAEDLLQEAVDQLATSKRERTESRTQKGLYGHSRDDLRVLRASKNEQSAYRKSGRHPAGKAMQSAH